MSGSPRLHDPQRVRQLASKKFLGHFTDMNNPVREIMRRYWRGETISKQEFALAWKEYLNSPNWKARCALVMQRDDGICRRCGTERATQTHHLYYRNRFHECLDDLISLCDTCHARLSGKSKAMEFDPGPLSVWQNISDRLARVEECITVLMKMNGHEVIGHS